MEGEVWNEVTGVSESTMVTGLALGMLKVTILSLSGVGTEKRPIKPENTRIIVALKEIRVPGEDKKDKGYEGQPGPAPVVSRKGSYPKSGKKVGVSHHARMRCISIPCTVSAFVTALRH